ncbi:hypothetical protein BH11PLA1_BH11PLA1_23770 [soil metagenome]
MPHACRAWLAGCVFVLAVAFVGAMAAAQSAGPRPYDADTTAGVTRIAAVRVGYEGVALAERWTPIIVTLESGAVAAEVRLAIDYVQDATQTTRLQRDAATTPGRTTSVTFYAALPDAATEITIRLEASDRKGGQTVRLVAYTPSENDLHFEPLYPGDALAVGVVGDALGLGGRELRFEPPAPSGAARGSSGPRASVVVSLTAETAPSGALGYDMFRFVVIGGEELAKLEPRQVAALREYVEMGGTAVVLVNQPGNDWKRLWPGAAPALPEVGDVVRGDAEAMNALRKRLTENEGRRGRVAGFSLAPALSFRSITLSAAAVGDGWRSLAPRDGERGAREQQGLNPAREHLAVGGPLGLGEVYLIGFRPQSALGTITPVTSAWLWRALLSADNPGLLRVPREEDAARRSGGSVRSAAAIYGAIALLCDVPPIPMTALYAILVGGILLACLLGPIDRLMLGRLKLRHRSWLSALIWIAVASVAAYWLPEVFRTVPMSSRRLEIIDASVGTRSSAASVGVTSVFADRSDAFAFAPARVGHTRGVAASTSVRDMGRMPQVTYAQTAERTAPGEVRMGRWTLQSWLDQEPAEAPRLAFGGTRAAPTIAVSGLPEGTTVTMAEVMTPWRTWITSIQRAAEGTDAAPRGAGATLNLATERIFAPVAPRPTPGPTTGGAPSTTGTWRNFREWQGIFALVREYRYSARGEEEDADAEGAAEAIEIGPPTLFALPGAEGRTRMHIQHLRSGGWGVLLLKVEGGAPAVGVLDAAQQTMTRLYRISFPIPGVWSAAEGEAAPARAPEAAQRNPAPADEAAPELKP